MPEAMPVLSVEGLSKSYGGRLAVDGISFVVRPGEVVGLLGPNGAGKTTTLSMVLGVLAPDAGTVCIDGLDMAKDRLKALEQANFAAVYSPLPGNLTVEQNLRVFAMLYGVKKPRARIDELIRRFDLERFRRTRCGVLSSGEQTRAALAKAMINSPRLLLLDEPTASLDPAVARDIRAQIRAFADCSDSGTPGGVLWTSHNMQEVEAVCDRVLLLSGGRILMEGDPAELPGRYGENSLEDLFVRVAGRTNGAEAEPDQARLPTAGDAPGKEGDT